MARYTGGCLCGALRYEATEDPTLAGYCFCADCRKASGSGFIPFMGFTRSALTFKGLTFQYRSTSARGSEAVRNSCPICASLVFGGDAATCDSFTIYAGSLDEPSTFHPTIAIFTRHRPAWAVMPAGLTVFDELPPSRPA